MLNCIKIAFVISLCCFSFLLSAQTVTFYVSKSGNDNAAGTSSETAVATIQQAKKNVRTYIQQHKFDTMKVLIASGEYEIQEPLVFEPGDAGKENAVVIYSALPGNKVVISGGKKVSGWKKYNKNTWVADIKNIDTANRNFKDLFINSERRQKSRLPETGYYRVKGFPDGSTPYNKPGKRFEYNADDIQANWKNLQDIEVVVYHFWTDTHLSIASVDAKHNIVSFKNPSGKAFTDDFNTDGARYIVENVWESLKSAGQWYADRKNGKLYYIPFPGENMNDVEAVVPVAKSFIECKGDALTEKYVNNIYFEHLNFKYANSPLPEGSVNNAQGSLDLPSAITLKAVKNCSFNHCSISNLSGYAFDIQEGCINNNFHHNSIANISGGAFKISGGTLNDNPLLRTHDNVIADNEIAHYGINYPSAVGILLRHAYNTIIEHNSIHDGYYTGISVGWEWGYQPSVSRGNIIAFNHIYNIGKGQLSDMGAIYTLGVSPGTIIKNNLIHDVDAHSYGGWGIYNDEGSSHILVENNIVYNTKFAAYNIHYAKEIVVRNNIFAIAKLQQLNRTRIEPHQSVFFENNIIYWKEGVLLDGNWDTLSYNYYLNPNLPDNGTKRMNHTFTMDYNLYYNPGLSIDSIVFYKQSWQNWHKLGNDNHSLYTDPLFIDPLHNNFSLQSNSPVFSLGFKPIDIKGVGPRN
ncbi:MAG: right-handed parallel beta-helix repeat-containing protein [Chitinophagaceae bacterium]|nr:right-handed parallel beta-helix repeat-containing protein [Chitinophagaceae bacterium]